MATFIKENRVLLILTGITILCAMIILSGRLIAENNNKAYDVVLDYNEIEAMASQSDYDMDFWFQKFKSLGINKVGLTEESLITLMEETDYNVQAEVMARATENARWQEKYPEGFTDRILERGYDSFDVIAEAKGKEIANFLKKGIEERIDKDLYILFEEGDSLYIFIDGTSDVALYSEKYKYQNANNRGYQERIDVVSSKIMYISLGFLKEKVEKCRDAGFVIVPRTMSYSGYNSNEFARAVTKGYEENGIMPDYIIIGGQAVLGFDEGTDFIENYITKNNIKLGLIENTNQRQNIMQFGLLEVSQLTSYQNVRVFTVWPYIQNRYQYYGYQGSEEIENTLYRAIVERNIRVIYYRPIFENEDLHTYVTDSHEYEALFTGLEERLEKHGFYMGEAEKYIPYEVSLLLKIMVGLGSIFGALILLSTLFRMNRRVKTVLALAGSLGVIFMALKMPHMYELLCAFSGAVIFSSIALSYFVAMSKQASLRLSEDSRTLSIMIIASLTLVVSVMVALLGGLMSAAPISSISYMLEIDIFRGVKAAQLIPLLVFVFSYLAFFGCHEEKATFGILEGKDIKKMLNTQIKIWMAVIAVIILGMGVYYIIRTGHSSTLKVSSLEMIFRNHLEDILLARPRSKEFLIAFPAISVMVYASVRRLKIISMISGLLGVIGMTSVANTFQHIRTPLYLGLYRTFIGLLFGLILGLIWIFVIEILNKLYNKYLKKGFMGL